MVKVSTPSRASHLLGPCCRPRQQPSALSVMVNSFERLRVLVFIADAALRDAVAHSLSVDRFDCEFCSSGADLRSREQANDPAIVNQPQRAILCDLPAADELGLLVPGDPGAGLPAVVLLDPGRESAARALANTVAEVLLVDREGAWLRLLPNWLERALALRGAGPPAGSAAPAAQERLMAAVAHHVPPAQWNSEKLKLLNAALETATDGILITDPTLPDNPIIYASPSFSQLTGYSAAETLGRNCRFLQGPDTDRAVVAQIRESLERGEPFHGVLLNYRRDGKPFWNELRIRPFRNADGVLTWFVGSLSDITERRKAEDELHAYQERFASAFRSSPNPSTISRVADGMVYEVNDQAERFFGLSREAIVGHTSIELNLYQDPSTRQRALEIFQREGRVRNFEAELRTAGDDVRQVLVSAEPIDVDGTPCVLTTIHDMTEQRRAEERARQHLAALAHMNRLVTAGELASGLAHELNQPLSSIQTHAELALAALPAERSDLPGVAPLLGTVVSQVQRASNIIKMLRSLVRKDRPRRTTTALNDLVRSTVFLMEPALRDAGVRLSLDLCAQPTLLLCDPIQISQVLLNLLQNALEALEEVPRERRAVSIGTTVDQNTVVLAVSDSGVGLPPGGIERLFDSFYSTKPGGLGLGLNISKSLVEAHGGRLDARANPSNGAIFEITLTLIPGV